VLHDRKKIDVKSWL